MDELHQHFNEAMQKEAVPARVLAAIIAKKLKAQGIKCSPVRARKMPHVCRNKRRETVRGVQRLQFASLGLTARMPKLCAICMCTRDDPHFRFRSHVVHPEHGKPLVFDVRGEASLLLIAW